MPVHRGLPRFSEDDIKIVLASGFVQMAFVPDLQLLAVNLPWGPPLANIYGELLCPQFDQTLIVGGVGSRRVDLEPEGLFAARHLAAAEGAARPIQNTLVSHAETLGITVSQGTLRSTHGSIKSRTSKPLPPSDAVDMESAYLLQFAAARVGCLHYVMDSAHTGMSLSATYYNPEWLAWLASKSTRAKNLCYATVLKLCGESGAESLVEV